MNKKHTFPGKPWEMVRIFIPQDNHGQLLGSNPDGHGHLWQMWLAGEQGPLIMRWFSGVRQFDPTSSQKMQYLYKLNWERFQIGIVFCYSNSSFDCRSSNGKPVESGWWVRSSVGAATTSLRPGSNDCTELGAFYLFNIKSGFPYWHAKRVTIY